MRFSCAKSKYNNSKKKKKKKYTHEQPDAYLENNHLLIAIRIVGARAMFRSSVISGQL